MVLSFNLNRLMQLAALPKDFKESKMKALRFHIIQLPGRIIQHARQVYVSVEKYGCELLMQIRCNISKVHSGIGGYSVNTT